MNAVLIPVRSMTGAKNRLAAELDDDARTRLTLAMLADMVAAAALSRAVDGVYVVSADPSLLDRAQALGARTLEESALLPTAATAQIRGGLNRAVFAAASVLESRGVGRLLAIPGDVPLITPAEIDEAFAAAEQADVVLVPSASGTGTNGLLLAPPTVMAPRFEGESLRAHAGACDDAGLVYRIRTLAGFALDIDTADDLRTLAAAPSPGESAAVARELLTRQNLRATA